MKENKGQFVKGHLAVHGGKGEFKKGHKPVKPFLKGHIPWNKGNNNLDIVKKKKRAFEY